MAHEIPEVLVHGSGRAARAGSVSSPSNPRFRVSLMILAIMGALTMMGRDSLAQITVVLDVGGTGADELKAEVAELLVEVVSINPALELADHRDMTIEDALEMLAYDEVSDEFLVDITLSFEGDRLLYASVNDVGGVPTAEIALFDALMGTALLSGSYPLSSEEERDQMTYQLYAEVGNQAIVEFVADRPGVQVTVDGNLLGEAPAVSYGLGPGPHSVSATCSDCEVMTRQVTLSAGRFVRENVTPEQLSAYVREPDGGGRNLLLPSLTVGTGAALLGTGVAFGLMTQSKQEDFDTANTIEQAEELADQGETYATLTNVFLISGSALAVAGIVLFFVGGGDDDDAEEPAQAQNGRANTSGWVAGDGGGVLLDWNF